MAHMAILLVLQAGCAGGVGLGSRFGTFSYHKKLGVLTAPYGPRSCVLHTWASKGLLLHTLKDAHGLMLGACASVH